MDEAPDKGDEEMKKEFLAINILLGLLLPGLGCGESTTSDSATLTLGERCPPSRSDFCPASMCRDVVSGESCDQISCANWDQPAIVGTICTKTCSSASDCAASASS